MSRAARFQSAFTLACAASLVFACGGSSSSLGVDGGRDTGGGTTSHTESGTSTSHETGTTTSHVCTPSQMVSCSCGGGATGTQVCASDGSGYGPCSDCSASVPEGGSNPDGPGGGDEGGAAEAGSEGGADASDDGSADGGSSDAADDSPIIVFDAGADGGQASCIVSCANQNPAGFQTFEGDELQACGCSSSAAPCATQCTSTCATPSTLSQSSPCGQCLLAQAQQTTSSSCTVTAGEQCFSNTQCGQFLSCAQGCPSQ